MKLKFTTLIIFLILLIKCRNISEPATGKTDTVMDSQMVGRPKNWPRFDTTVSLHFQNALLSTVLDSLRQHTGYVFTYSPNDFDSLGTKVTIDVDNISADTIILHLAEGQKILRFIAYPPESEDGRRKRFVITAKKKGT